MEAPQEDVQYDTSKSETTRITPLATLVVGLVIGVLVGYAGRPLITPQPLPPAPAASASAADPSVSGNASQSASNSLQPTLMDAVVAQTRHFKGAPNAPVTIVEFGDFQ